MISLIQMQYLAAIDTYRHFATAAEKCFVTQPTLSMQVKKVEEELGVKIFDRTRQPVIPTQAGIAIIEQVRRILKEAEKIDLLVQEMQQEVSGDLTLGIIPTISPYLLPLFAGAFKQKYPAVHLKVQEVVTERIEELLKKDLLDAGILVTPLHNPGIIEQPLFYEEMMIYTNMQHPLSTQPIINIGDIATPEMWLLSDGHCFRHQVVNLCHLHDLKSDVLPFEFEGGSLDTMMKIIDKEGGYTLIPELAGLEITNDAAHKVRRFSGITPLREVSLVVNRRFAKTNLLQNLANEITRAVPPDLLNKERGVVVEWR
ncbi:MAG: LysR family transcriptional regulator [Bacteroidetes bacterium]|nr:LysR family transcriptional regulator [Bacteroidota bacterium]